MLRSRLVSNRNEREKDDSISILKSEINDLTVLLAKKDNDLLKVQEIVSQAERVLELASDVENVSYEQALKTLVKKLRNIVGSEPNS